MFVNVQYEVLFANRHDSQICQIIFISMMFDNNNKIHKKNTRSTQTFIFLLIFYIYSNIYYNKSYITFIFICILKTFYTHVQSSINIFLVEQEQYKWTRYLNQKDKSFLNSCDLTKRHNVHMVQQTKLNIFIKIHKNHFKTYYNVHKK